MWLNVDTPKSSMFNGIFHYKPSIWGCHHLWKPLWYPPWLWEEAWPLGCLTHSSRRIAWRLVHGIASQQIWTYTHKLYIYTYMKMHTHNYVYIYHCMYIYNYIYNYIYLDHPSIYGQKYENIWVIYPFSWVLGYLYQVEESSRDCGVGWSLGRHNFCAGQGS
jgi:hypothetical protein